MRAIVNLIVAAMLLAGLVGCAAFAAKEPHTVKCPSCGYEFTVPGAISGGP